MESTATSRHQCLIYDGAPSHKLPMLAAIMRQKMNEGYRCLYMNSPAMVAGMRSRLAAMDMDVAHEIAKARLVLSAEPVTTGTDFDSEGLLYKLEDMLNQALNDGYKGLWATGDMTWEFGASKDFNKLIEYEWGLEQIFRRRKEMSGICQYHKDTLPHQVIREGLLSHSSVAINQTLTRINPHYIKSGFTAAHAADHPELDAMITELCNLPD